MDYIPLTVSEAALVNDSLRIMELSLLWYGTREHSWERFSKFVVEEGANAISNARAMITAKMHRRVRPLRYMGLLCWYGIMKRIFFQLTGIAFGRFWVRNDLCSEIAEVTTRFLTLSSRDCCPADEELASLKREVSIRHALMSGVLPVGSPRSRLRFYGCEDYGKIASSEQIDRPEGMRHAV